MKENIHPKYREVVFKDTACGKEYIIASTIETNRTCEIDGRTYPLALVEVSSASHPFYTGKQTNVNTDSRVKKFNDRFGSLLGNVTPAE